MKPIKTSKIMNVSLNHLSKTDEIEFMSHTSPFKSAAIGRDEYLVRVPYADALPESDHTSAFLELIDSARKNNCKYIEFLVNGPVYDQFENFKRVR
jgi:hypothetical protein